MARYNQEQILHAINAHFISLSKEEENRNNIILHSLIEKITSCMCSIDSLFNDLFKRNKHIFYGGSYYDGLKVGKPDEFDIDMLLNLPKDVEISTSTRPGFVTVEVKNSWWEDFKVDKLCEITKSTKYLDTSKVLSWIEGIGQQVLNTFEYIPHRGYALKAICGYDLYLSKYSKGGPAFTFWINGDIQGEHISMSIDLVPCFAFAANKLPSNGYKSNRDKMGTSGFFVVPKKPKDIEHKYGRYWRLSLQEQERIIMHDLGRAKPALKLLKKMRLTRDHCIDSYYLKTILLWEIKTQQQSYWHQNSLSYVFMELLKSYKTCLLNKNIPYFWSKNNNLIGFHNEATAENIGNRMKHIINDIERKSDDPFVIASYILTRSEQETLLHLLDNNLIPEVVENTSRCVIL